jgi:hypothetical protein
MIITEKMLREWGACDRFIEIYNEHVTPTASLDAAYRDLKEGGRLDCAEWLRANYRTTIGDHDDKT